MHKESVAEEIQSLDQGTGAPNWILDLSTTSLFNILSEFATEHSLLRVYCDQSKPLIANQAAFESMVNRPEMLGQKNFFGGPFGFNLTTAPEFVDSATHPGIQIADVLAATANYCVRNPGTETARSWGSLLRNSFANCNVVSDLGPADLDCESGFTGAAILNELIQRSIEKRDLLAGMPEFIARVRSYYPGWQVDRIARREHGQLRLTV